LLTEQPRIPLRDVILFGLWPSALKCWIYRLKGYRIGKDVSIGFGSVICGDRVEVGDRTSIGFLTIIRGKNIAIGAHVQIGSMTFLDTPNIRIGEGSRINELVFVGGLQYPDSQFVMGRNSHIMQMAFINPARSIIVGDHTGIGGHCLLFGHSSFLSQFEGYPVEFEPIEIGNSVGIGWGSFILPKTKIGDGTVVGPRSVVHGTIPPRCLALGFPARVISKAPEFPKNVSDKEKQDLFSSVIKDMIQFWSNSGLHCEKHEHRYIISEPRKRWWQRNKARWVIQVVDGDARGAAEHMTLPVDVFLSLWDIPDDVRQRLQSLGTMWIEIAKKEQSRQSNDLGDEVSNFLKRYGVRTNRVSERPSSVS
jgi:acetyltransferase-like isoleucine patch superfamily enzyme